MAWVVMNDEEKYLHRGKWTSLDEATTFDDKRSAINACLRLKEQNLLVQEIKYLTWGSPEVIC